VAFQGSLRELPLPDIIQLVAVSGKTGVFTLKNGAETGRIFLRKGQIVHAAVSTLVGEHAVYELARWQQGEFIFTPGTESFSPTEWAVVSKVDERRNIDEIAAGLGHGAFEVCKVIYGMLTAGVLALREDLRRLPLDRLQRMSPDEQVRIAEQIYRFGQQLMTGQERGGQLDGALRLFRAEMESGRGADAVLDLVRACEKVVSAQLGPNQAKTFLDRVGQLLQPA
jgi:hypothetical protein